MPASPRSLSGRWRFQGHGDEEGTSTPVPWEGYRLGRRGRPAEASSLFWVAILKSPAVLLSLTLVAQSPELVTSSGQILFGQTLRAQEPDEQSLRTLGGPL